MSYSPHALGRFFAAPCVLLSEFLQYQPMAFRFPAWRPVLPARHAYSHSASVGSRYLFLPSIWFSFRINFWQSFHETLSTGQSSPQFLKYDGLLPRSPFSTAPASPPWSACKNPASTSPGVVFLLLRDAGSFDRAPHHDNSSRFVYTNFMPRLLVKRLSGFCTFQFSFQLSASLKSTHPEIQLPQKTRPPQEHTAPPDPKRSLLRFDSLIVLCCFFLERVFSNRVFLFSRSVTIVR